MGLDMTHQITPMNGDNLNFSKTQSVFLDQTYSKLCLQVYQPSEEEIRGFLDPYANVVCVECQQGGDDNLMLLCDLCDSPSHTYCVGLGREVPEGNWYCNGCRSINQTPSRVSPSIQVCKIYNLVSIIDVIKF